MFPTEFDQSVVVAARVHTHPPMRGSQKPFYGCGISNSAADGERGGGARVLHTVLQRSNGTLNQVRERICY